METRPKKGVCRGAVGSPDWSCFPNVREGKSTCQCQNDGTRLKMGESTPFCSGLTPLKFHSGQAQMGSPGRPQRCICLSERSGTCSWGTWMDLTGGLLDLLQ